MRIGIVGAGFTGLTAGFRLSQKGHQVTLFEKEKKAGGLSAGFKKRSWDWYLEDFFHHLFISDTHAVNLIFELGLSQKLFFKKVKTSVLINAKISQFDSAFSVLTFPHLCLPERVRTGLATFLLKKAPLAKQFEKTRAAEILPKIYGEKPYQVLWEPLLKAKFGNQKDKISMSWFWARIKKRSSKLGYLEGGFQTLIDKIVQKIKENDGEIFLGQEVTNLESLKEFDKIIVATPTSAFLKMVPSLPKSYQKNLAKLEMIGALNLILVLKEKFLTDGTYWLNINEKGFPFVACVEHTNFINSKHYGGNHLLYVGGYYPQNHRYFKMGKEEIFQEFLPFLKKINPKFHQLSVTDYQLSANFYAQPIVTTNYQKIIPPHKTPLKNIFLANMQQVYPWDRGVNYAIKEGEEIAKEVLK